jgi:hypothetical protein
MIYLIITTSIENKVGNKDKIHRQNLYIECISHLLELIKYDSYIKPIIVENNGTRKTFLDDFSCDTLYTNNNRIECVHKGENELLDIKDTITHYHIKDDDMIIKLTGRYKLLNLNFIDLIRSNDCDAFVKFFNVCTKEYLFDDCVLGLFAMKCKFLKEFQYSFLRSPECEFANYTRNMDRYMEVDQLDLECCFADDLRILRV